MEAKRGDPVKDARPTPKDAPSSPVPATQAPLDPNAPKLDGRDTEQLRRMTEAEVLSVFD
jgi:hypothetical protein